MSFVLQALSKQEADGDPDAAVSLARAALHKRRQRLWMSLFGLAMAANLGLLAWVFGVPGTTKPPAAIERAVAPVQPSTTAPAAAEPRITTAPAHAASAGAEPPSTPAASTPAVADSDPPVPEAKPRPAPVAQPEPAPPVRVTLRGLPEDARARFPGIAFSTHIYAEDDDLRAVVANGRRIKEGERVRGLELVEITEGGVVLAFERYLVEVPIVTDWDAL